MESANRADAYRAYWAKSIRRSPLPALGRDLERDVAVIGGGIVGVTAAHRLAADGASVALLEARHLGAGATGYTTAKVTSLHGLTYSKLESTLGERAAQDYAAANETGLGKIAALVDSLGVDCEFRRKPNFTYTESSSNR